MPFKTVLAAAASLFAMLAPANAATLNVNGSGILTGATGVDIDGTLYDVTFQSGSCVALFDGCNEPSDHFFSSYAETTAAAQALLDQVFIDGILGNFDSDATKTEGCASATTRCWVHVAHGNNNGAAGSIAFNYSSGQGADYTSTGDVLSTFDFSGTGTTTFASFSLSNLKIAAAVPLPAPALLLLGGLGGLGLLRRKDRKA